MVTVGIDLQRIERFRFVRTEAGNAFWRRVYTARERLAVGTDLLQLALCFAGKEAVSKALGAGLVLQRSHGVPCADIEILSRFAGEQPAVFLSGRAREIATGLGLSGILLEWRHSPTLAYAVAIGVDSAVDPAGIERWIRETVELVGGWLEGLHLGGKGPRG